MCRCSRMFVRALETRTHSGAERCLTVQKCKMDAMQLLLLVASLQALTAVFD